MRVRLSHFLVDRPFLRNIVTVASGTAVAQAIAMAFVPVITRQYGPDAYGLQGIFLSLVNILAIAAPLGYSMAIVLPKSDVIAATLLRLAIYIVFATTVMVAFVVSLAGDRILASIDAVGVAPFAWLLPIAISLSSLQVILGQWLIRNSAYTTVARIEVLLAFGTNAGKVLLGAILPVASTLIVTNVVASAVGVALGYAGCRRTPGGVSLYRDTKPAMASLCDVAKLYLDFPKYRTPQNLINAISQSLPLVMLGAYFGLNASGQYAIAATMLGIPSALIGGSVMAVFYPRVTEAINNNENAKAMIVRTTVGMALTGGLPCIVIILGGPDLFELVFGDEWREAGEFSRWLSLYFLLQYLNKPAVAAVPALRLQRGLLVYEVFSTVSKLAAIWFAQRYIGNAVSAVAAFSIVGIAAYIWLIAWILRNAGTPRFQ